MAINKCINLVVYLLLAFMMTSCIKQSVSNNLRSDFAEPSSVSKFPITSESENFSSPHDFDIGEALDKGVREKSDKDEVDITSKDINDTLEIIIPSRGDIKSASFNSNDVEKISTPISIGDDYYKVKFYLTPKAIEKAESVVSFMSDFPISISINGKVFGFYIEDKAEYHFSRTFSSPTEGLKGFDCTLNESKITREDFKKLFTK